jgi:hypothetical protein
MRDMSSSTPFAIFGLTKAMFPASSSNIPDLTLLALGRVDVRMIPLRLVHRAWAVGDDCMRQSLYDYANSAIPRTDQERTAVMIVSALHEDQTP